MSTLIEKTNSSILSAEEIQAQDLVKRGEYDEAISIYQQIKPDSARIFGIIGSLYSERKGDYDSAINYHEKALHIQEENGEDTSSTLTNLALAHQNQQEYDVALIYYLRALRIRQQTSNTDHKLIASSLYGIANAYWGLQNLSEALSYAQQALSINQSVSSGNDINIATNLAILANIYHKSGDNIRALELAKHALIILERCVSPDSLTLAPLLNNIGTIQIGVGLFNDALLTFIRVLHICEKTLPEDHPKRIAISNNIQRVNEMQEYDNVNSFSHIWKFLPKILLV